MIKNTHNLREKATSGLGWSAVEKFGQTGCSFIVQIVLARLLLPEQFGLIAMVAVFVAISGAVVDSGFSNAIVQKKHLDDADICTAFQFNVAVGVLTAAVLWLMAPEIAAFYGQSELTPIVRWLALSLILGALGGVHSALLSRELAFGKTAFATIPATVLSGIVGVGMAYAGYGVWALVGQILTQQGGRSLLLWWQSQWRPRQHFSVASFKAMFPYGSRLALSGVLEQGFQNIYVLVIGKCFLPVEVGFYQRAKSFQQLPVSTIQSILDRVLFPVFAGMQDDPARLRRAMRHALQAGSLVIIPLMAIMAALAKPMTIVLIGSKWLPSVIMLQPLCLLGAMYPLHVMNLNLLMGLGRSDKFLKLEITKKALIVLNVVATYRFGVLPMIYGMIVMSVLALGLNAFYTQKYIGYGLMAQLKDIAAISALGVVMLGAIGWLAHGLTLNPWAVLLAGGALGVAIFMLGLRFMAHDLRTEIIQALRHILPLRLHWVTRFV